MKTIISTDVLASLIQFLPGTTQRVVATAHQRMPQLMVETYRSDLYYGRRKPHEIFPLFERDERNFLVLINGIDLKRNVQLDLLGSASLRLCALSWAARFGHQNAVNQLLMTQITDEEQTTLSLPRACRKGQLEIVRLLLDRNISARLVNGDVDFVARNGIVSLINACRRGFTQIVRFLLADRRINPSAQAQRAFMSACEEGRDQVVECLLNDGRIDPAVGNDAAIRIASRHGRAAVVAQLLAHSRVNPWAEDNEAIRAAAAEGHAEAVKCLLRDKRVNPSDRENEALRLASQNGHYEVVCLLTREPTVDPSARESEALRLASKKGHQKIVKHLLQLKDRRVDPTAREGEALREACLEGHTAVVSYLLRHSAVRPAARKSEALRLAYYAGHIEIVDLLLRDGCVNPTVRNNEVIRLAIGQGHYNIAMSCLTNLSVAPTVRSSLTHALINKLRCDGHVGSTYRKHQTIQLAALGGHEKILRAHLDRSLVSTEAYDQALITASYYGHQNVVRLLVVGNWMHLSSVMSKALRDSLAEGHIEISRILVNRESWSDEQRDTYLLWRAYKDKHHRTVRRLLANSHANPASYKDICFFEWAARRRDRNVIELLLKDKRVDPANNRNAALFAAIEGGYYGYELLYLKVVQALLADGRAFERMIEWGQDGLLRSLLKLERLHLQEHLPKENNYLLQAVKAGKTDMVKLLLSDKDLCTSKKIRAAYQVACDRSDKKLIELIKPHVSKKRKRVDNKAPPAKRPRPLSPRSSNG